MPDFPLTLSLSDDVHEILGALAHQNGYPTTTQLLNTVLTDLARTHFDSDAELRRIVANRRSAREESEARHPSNHLRIVQ